MPATFSPTLAGLGGTISDIQHGARTGPNDAHELADITGLAAHAARHNAGGADAITVPPAITLTKVETTTTFTTSSTTLVDIPGLSIVVTTASGANAVEIAVFIPSFSKDNANVAAPVGGTTIIRNNTDGATITGARHMPTQGSATGGVLLDSFVYAVRLTTLAAAAKTIVARGKVSTGSGSWVGASDVAADAPMTLFAKEYR